MGYPSEIAVAVCASCYTSLYRRLRRLRSTSQRSVFSSWPAQVHRQVPAPTQVRPPAVMHKPSWSVREVLKTAHVPKRRGALICLHSTVTIDRIEQDAKNAFPWNVKNQKVAAKWKRNEA